MISNSKLKELKKRRKEILRRISKAISLRNYIIKQSKKIAYEYTIGKNTGEDYKNKIKKGFGDKTPHEWIEYYDNYIFDCRQQLEECDGLIEKEKSTPLFRVSLIFIGIVLLILCSFLLFNFLTKGEISYGDILFAPQVPVTIDSSSSGFISSGQTLTWQHTVGVNSDRLLAVGISYDGRRGETITGVTYGGVPLTFVRRDLKPSGRNSGRYVSEIYYMVAPASGTADIIVTFSISLGKPAIGGSVSFDGVDQTTPISNDNGAWDETTTPTTTIISDVNDIVFDNVASYKGNILNPGAGQTQQWQDGITGTEIGAGSTESGAASVIMDWTGATTDGWAISAVNVRAKSIPGPSVDQPTSFTTYNDLNLPFGVINSIDVQVDVSSYDDSISINQASLMPDLELDLWDGTGFVNVGSFLVNGIGSFTINIVNPTILSAWQLDPLNQDIRIRAINMDNDGSISDQITYDNLFVSLNGKEWTQIGSHIEGSNFIWDTSLLPNQIGIDLRTRAIDPLGSNTYSNYFTKGSSLEIFHPVVGNQPPIITFVSDINELGGDLSPGVVDPIAGTTSTATVSFIVEDSNGAADIDSNSATVQFSFNGETNIGTCSEAPTCDASVCTGNQKNFTCNVDMNYYNSPSTLWNAQVGISDFNSPTPNTATDNSKLFEYTSVTSMTTELSASVSWPSISPIGSNQPSSSPLILLNKGNLPVNSVSLTVYDLIGQSIPSQTIPSQRFSAGPNTGGGAECDFLTGTATQLPINGGSTTISGISIPYGDGTGGNDQSNVYFCLWSDMSDLILTDSSGYSTQGYTPWDIIALAVFIIRIKKKRKKKLTNKDREEIISILGNNPEYIKSLIEEQKTRNELTIPLDIFTINLSPAEAISKYLKENKKLSFREIGSLLNRDERTIWINYRNAADKHKSIIKLPKDYTAVPLEICSNRKLSILESIVKHLKDNNLSNKEIHELMGISLNNIWTLSNRTEKKSRIKTKLSKEEELLEKIKDNIDKILLLIEQRKDNQELITELEKEELTIPLDIFINNLSPAEAISKYLKENKKLSFHEIGKLLNRDERTIWINYRNANKKSKSVINIPRIFTSVPISIFMNRKLSILESIVKHLKDNNFSKNEIAELIGKGLNNVWTLERRIDGKIGG